MEQKTSYVQYYNGLSKRWYKVKVGNGIWSIESTSPDKFKGVPEHVKGKSYRKSKAKFDTSNLEKSENSKEIGDNPKNDDGGGFFWG